MELCHPVLGDRMGWSPRSRGSQGRGLGVGREKFDRVVSEGAQAFESGHTCLSCERPHSPWLAGIPNQRQRETERVECETLRVKRKLKHNVE